MRKTYWPPRTKAEMKDPKRSRPQASPVARKRIETIFRLVDLGVSQAEVARRLRVTRQAIWKTLRTSYYRHNRSWK